MGRDPPRFDPLDAELGPARPLSEAEARSQADLVVARIGPRRRRVRVGLLAAAALVTSSGAFAAVQVWEARSAHHAALERARRERAPHRAKTAEPEPAPTPALPPAATSLGGLEPRVPAPPEAANPRTVEPQVPASPALTKPGAPEPASAAAPGVLNRSARASTEPRDGLALANLARAARQFARAEQLYLRVARQHPGTDDADAANLAAADLRTQHLRRPRRAIALYRELIAAEGPLAEQARAGLAGAYRALGDRAAERRAWSELLRKHPQSWFAPEARARLEQL